MYFTYTITVKQ